MAITKVKITDVDEVAESANAYKPLGGNDKISSAPRKAVMEIS